MPLFRFSISNADAILFTSGVEPLSSQMNYLWLLKNQLLLKFSSSLNFAVWQPKNGSSIFQNAKQKIIELAR